MYDKDTKKIFPTEFFVYCVKEKGPSCCWIVRRALGTNGSLLPGGRIVFFCKTVAEAECWIEKKAGLALRVTC